MSHPSLSRHSTRALDGIAVFSWKSTPLIFRNLASSFKFVSRCLISCCCTSNNGMLEAVEKKSLHWCLLRLLRSHCMIHPVHGILLQAAVLGSQGPSFESHRDHRKPPALKPIKLQKIPKQVNAMQKRTVRALEETALPESQIRKLTGWRHSRCMPKGVHPVAPRELQCAHGHQGSLVAPHVRHQKRDTAWRKGRGHNLLGWSEPKLRHRWQNVLQSGEACWSKSLAPKFPRESKKITYLVQCSSLLGFPSRQDPQ